MSEMVDRCVKAGINGKTDFAQWHPDVQAELVRTIISAMREPTGQMVKSAFALGPEAQCAPEVWETMIDEALK